MSNEQFERLSVKIDELTETFKSQSEQLEKENFWMRALIIFLLTAAISTVIITQLGQTSI